MAAGRRGLAGRRQWGRRWQGKAGPSGLRFTANLCVRVTAMSDGFLVRLRHRCKMICDRCPGSRRGCKNKMPKSSTMRI